MTVNIGPMASTGKVPQVQRGRPGLTLSGSQNLFLWSGIVSLIGVLVSVIELWSKPVLSVVTLAIMSFCFWACLRAGRTGATYLACDADALTISIRSKKETIPWKKVKKIRSGWTGVEPVNIAWNQYVFIDCADQPKPILIYPRIFGVGAEQLVELIMPYYDDACSGANTFTSSPNIAEREGPVTYSTMSA
jgi:hypothetical protein